MTAELRHHFSHLTGRADNARPYVERFLQAYAPLERDRKYLATMLPFFESRGFFKIAMLGYWKRDYKRYLVEQGTRRIEEIP
jgi:hypothetical protein